MKHKYDNVPMPDFLRRDLEAFLEELEHPSGRNIMDCLMMELEGSLKACASFGSITQEFCDEILYEYLYERPKCKPWKEAKE